MKKSSCQMIWVRTNLILMIWAQCKNHMLGWQPDLKEGQNSTYPYIRLQLFHSFMMLAAWSPMLDLYFVFVKDTLMPGLMITKYVVYYNNGISFQIWLKNTWCFLFLIVQHQYKCQKCENNMEDWLVILALLG
jgi:hypothetical protein